MAIKHLKQPGTFKKVFPPLRGVLLLKKSSSKDIHIFIGWRKLEAIHIGRVLKLLRREFVAEDFGADAQLPTLLEMLEQMLQELDVSHRKS